MKSKPKKTESEPMSGAFQKVAECLYRHMSSGKYYGLVKRSGKQYRRSLKTTDRKLAERFIGEFRQKIDRLDHTKARSNITFAECAKLWLATVVPQLKASSALRRETSVGQILPYLGSITVRNLTANTCESWAGKRGPGVAASTYNNERDMHFEVIAQPSDIVLLEKQNGSVVTKVLSDETVRQDFELEPGCRFLGKLDNIVFYWNQRDEDTIRGRDLSRNKTYHWKVPGVYMVEGVLRGTKADFAFVVVRKLTDFVLFTTATAETKIIEVPLKDAVVDSKD